MPSNYILRVSTVNETFYCALIIASVSAHTHTINQKTSREHELGSFLAIYNLNCYGLYMIITVLSLDTDLDRSS